MFSTGLYLIAGSAFLISLIKDLGKTKKALKKTIKVFLNLLPQLSAVFIFVGMLLAVVDKEFISLILGENSGALGSLVAGLLGSITLLPGFVAFPLASNLLAHGAGITQIAVFVSTLMMVGVATFPLETQYFGKKVAVARNMLAFIFSFLVAGVIGGMVI